MAPTASPRPRGSLIWAMVVLVIGCARDPSMSRPNPSEDDGASHTSTEGEDTESTSTGPETAPVEAECEECGPEELCVGRFRYASCGPFGCDCEPEDLCGTELVTLGCEPRPEGCAPGADPCDPSCMFPLCGMALCFEGCAIDHDYDVFCPLDHNSICLLGYEPCSLVTQNCPEDERCLPLKDVEDLDAIYTHSTCRLTVLGTEGVGEGPGEPCLVPSLTQFDDNCGLGAICWDLVEDEGGYAGVCHELCMDGTCSDGHCVSQDPWSFMYVCEPGCEQGGSCPNGELCTLAQTTGEPGWVCLPG